MRRLAPVVLAACLASLCVSAGTHDSHSLESGSGSIDSSSKSSEETFPELSTLIDVDNDRGEYTTSYEGSQVFRIQLRTKDDTIKYNKFKSKRLIEELKASRGKADVLVSPELLNNVERYLNESSLMYEILISDVHRKIVEQVPPLSEEELELIGKQGHQLTFERYHQHKDISGYLTYLSETYKELVSVERIGSSHEGRPIEVLKISSGKPNATGIFVDGGIHAREWIASSTALYIARELVENRENLEPVMKDFDYYILPLLNPDGYEYSREKQHRMFRKNKRTFSNSGCIGVDLNRNFGYKWGGLGASGYNCLETYHGPSPNSEPETKAITSYLLKKMPSIQGYTTFHSYGQYILYPWGYNTRVPPDYQDLHRVGQIAAERIKKIDGQNYKVGNSADLLYPASGGADDWVKARAKIKYAYTVELRDEGTHGFLLPPSYIKTVGKEGFEVIRAIAEALAQPSENRGS